jgi:hypothetical protein
MTPAGSAIPAIASDQAIPERILRDGEQIIFAVKPSAWFILLNSIQTLIILGLMTVFVASVDAIGVSLMTEIRRGLLLGLPLAMGFTLLLSCFRWVGRLYVLTDRRLLRICGFAAARVDVYECELARINSVDVTVGIAERIMGIGSLKFEIEDNPYSNPDWINIAQIQNVAEEVRAAVSRAKK